MGRVEDGEEDEQQGNNCGHFLLIGYAIQGKGDSVSLPSRCQRLLDWPARGLFGGRAVWPARDLAPCGYFCHL